MPVSLSSSQLIYDALKACEVGLISALPETWLVHLIRMGDDDPDMTLVRLAKEEEGVGVTEFTGWTFVNKDWWAFTSDDQAGMAEKLEAMVRAQSKELDVVKRQAMVHDIERILATETFYLIPFPWSNVFPAWSSNVKGWNLGPFPSQVKWSQWERMWLTR